jgi:hypothetical protein
MAETNSKFTLWFNRKFLDWQDTKGRRQSLVEFSKFLDLEKSIISYYLNGSRAIDPLGENAYKIYLRFHDIYDVLEVSPDIDKLNLKFNLDALTDDEIKSLSKTINERKGIYTSK